MDNKSVARTIGQQIGVVEHTLSITNSKDEKATINIKIDFSTASDTEIKSWLCSNRGIAGQRPWRSLTKAEIMELNGRTFDACSIGTKPKSMIESTTALLNRFEGKSKAEIVAEFVKAGMSEIKAEILASAMLTNDDGELELENE